MNNTGIVGIAIIGLFTIFLIDGVFALEIPDPPTADAPDIEQTTEEVQNTAEQVQEATQQTTEEAQNTTEEIQNTAEQAQETTQSQTSGTSNTSSSSSNTSQSTNTPASTPNTSQSIQQTPNTSQPAQNTPNIPAITLNTKSGSDTQNDVLPETTNTQLLDSATLDTWKTSFSATVVSGNVSSSLTDVNQMPTILTFDGSVTVDVTDLQSSVLLDVAFPPLTDGWTIVRTVGLPSYSVPESSSSIIPAIVTTVDSSSGQFIIAPLGKIISGQQITISVADSLIPSFGGLKELSLQPSLIATPIGYPPPYEWITVEVNNKIPASLPTEGMHGTPVLFVNLQYPFELSGVGYNWSNPDNFEEPPTMTLVVNKIHDETIVKDNVGCPIIDAFTLSAGSWTSNGLGQVYSKSINQNQCQVKIQTQHFSKFAFSLRHINSIHSSATSSFSLGKVVNDPTVNLMVIQDRTLFTPTVTQKLVVKSQKYASESSEGFSNVVCSPGYAFVFMTGQFTAGDIPYKVIFLTMELLDGAGKVLVTGSGSISDVGSQKTKVFNALTRYNGEFDSCAVKINNAIPK